MVNRTGLGQFLDAAAMVISPEFRAGREEALNRRTQNTLNDLNIQQRQLNLDASRQNQQNQQAQFEQQEQVKAMQIGVRLAEALKKVPNHSERLEILRMNTESLMNQGFDKEDLDQFFDRDPQIMDQKLDRVIQSGSIFLEQAGQPLTSGQREFQSLTEGFSEEDQERAKRIKAGLEPRATGSAAQTILNLGTAQQVADVEKTLAGGKEEGKLEAQFKFKPLIQAAVKEAEAAAKEKGEVLTDLQRSQAALPGLLESVGELKKLAPIATSTFGGRAFDFTAKELGFGSTEGATARKKFIAIVNNQVLPLLKPTFGAAFTVAEGDALRATMGDPDSTPEEKLAELDAFIQNKFREIETKERQLGQRPQGQIMEDANGNRAIVYPDGSFEEIQ